MRILSGLLLLFSAATAGAVPVSMGSGIYDQGWQWQWYMGVRGGGIGTHSDDHPRYQYPIFQAHFHEESEYGYADSQTYAAMYRRQTGTDDQFTFDVTVDLSVSAETSIGVPVTGSRRGYSYAQIGLDFAVFAFDVAESVIYSGTQELWHEDPAYTRHFPWMVQSDLPEFASGSVLTPGRYYSYISADRLLAYATPGESIQLFSRDAFSYNFVRVPVPPTLSLMLLGLAGLAYRRRKGST